MNEYVHTYQPPRPRPPLISLQEDLEKPILAASAAFYQRLSSEYLRDSDCPAYLEKAERCLKEEGERVRAYLAPSSEGALVQARAGGGGPIYRNILSVSGLYYGFSCFIVCYLSWMRFAGHWKKV